MKRLGALVICIALCASSAWAQTDTLVGIRKGSIEVGAATGLSIPVGDYGDWASLSGTGAVILGYYPSPRVSFGVDWGGHWHGPTDQADSLKTIELGQSDAELKLKLYRILTPYIKYQFKVAKVSPYATGIMGFYLQEVKWTEQTIGGTVSQSVSQGYFGVGAGLGIQWVTDDNVEIFLEGRFHNAMRDGATPIQFIDARVGLAFLL